MNSPKTVQSISEISQITLTTLAQVLHRLRGRETALMQQDSLPDTLAKDITRRVNLLTDLKQLSHAENPFIWIGGWNKCSFAAKTPSRKGRGKQRVLWAVARHLDSNELEDSKCNSREVRFNTNSTNCIKYVHVQQTHSYNKNSELKSKLVN